MLYGAAAGEVDEGVGEGTGVGQYFGQVEFGELAVADHYFAANQDGVYVGGSDGVDEGCSGVVEGLVVGLGEVEEGDVCLAALF